MKSLFDRGKDRKRRLQDLVVLLGLFLFSTILILGLLPRSEHGSTSLDSFFMNIMMIIPVVISIYFIIISFRRKVSNDRTQVSTSIRTKIMLALLFVAIIPTLPITIISNNIVNSAISELLTFDTQTLLNEADKLSKQSIKAQLDSLKTERNWYKLSIENGFIDPSTWNSLNYVARSMKERGIIFESYVISTVSNKSMLIYKNSAGNPYRDDIHDLFQIIKNRPLLPLYKLSIHDKSVLISFYISGEQVGVFYKVLPDALSHSDQLINEAGARYEQKSFFIPYIQNAIGIFLLILSILVVIVSVALSFVVSKSITKPVYELVDASRMIAKGDFSVELKRHSSDEIALLYGSFNSMVKQLDESRRAMLHMQKLEAWKEVGSKLMHEIKNPLTPIRLSAERIRRKYFAHEGDIDAIVQTGTDTIIEEVDALQHILREFSRYTRLPKLTPVKQNVNEIMQNCVDFFHGHEKIEFKLFIDELIPDINLDRILLRQVLINIIKNAIEAMKYEGEIVIRTTLQADKVEIRIRDNGPGIAQEDLLHLFEPTFSRKQNGTGLGLAIVEKIILEHGGKIFCRSIIGNGAEFIISLPTKE